MIESIKRFDDMLVFVPKCEVCGKTFDSPCNGYEITIAKQDGRWTFPIHEGCLDMKSLDRINIRYMRSSD